MEYVEYTLPQDIDDIVSYEFLLMCASSYKSTNVTWRDLAHTLRVISDHYPNGTLVKAPDFDDMSIDSPEFTRLSCYTTIDRVLHLVAYNHLKTQEAKQKACDQFAEAYKELIFETMVGSL